MIIKGYRVEPLLRKTGREILDDNILGLGAQTAYYFFFSLFPLLLFSAPLIGLVAEFDTVVATLARAVPPAAFEIIRGALEDVFTSESAPGLMSAGLLLAAWAGSNIFSSLIDALNRAYDVEESRPWWKKKLISLAAVAVAGFTILLATVTMLGGEDIVHWVGDRLGLDQAARAAWIVLQVVLSVAFLVALAWGIYQFLPNCKQNWRHTLVGALVATVFWILVTLAFRAYVQNFGSYNKTYGTIGGVIALLTWMYLSMLVVLSAGELTAELNHGTGAVDPRRGATYLGRVATAGGPVRPSTERVERVQPLAARGPE
jgi:membrane protein